jgi:hypothetical protein
MEARQPRRTRVPWVIGAVMILVFVAVALVAGGKKSSTPKADPGAGVRAVLVPTADEARTIVVPPCEAVKTLTARNASTQRRTTGATTVELPRRPGARTVLVPRCTTGKGVAPSGKVSLPSAAYVLEIGAEVTPAKAPKAKSGVPPPAAEQVIVPRRSAARTIVVPPCSGKGAKGRAAVVGAPAPGSDIALAPRC